MNVVQKNILVVAIALLSTLAQAASLPQPSANDARLGEFTYDPGQVFLLPLKANVATHIVLESDETIVLSAPGLPSDCKSDAAAWCISAPVGANSFFVKPKAGASGINNLALTTNKRIYSFDLSLNLSTVMYRVTFKYPEQERTLIKKSRLNWDYSKQESSDGALIAPLAMFDDGKSTYLKFTDTANLPQIYAVSPDGVEHPLTARLNNEGWLVLSKVGERYILRQGKAFVGLWNEFVR